MENATLEKRTEILDRTAERIALTESVRRIAEYDNPVELVNNLYGCHPDGNGSDYFSRIYRNL